MKKIVLLFLSFAVMLLSACSLFVVDQEVVDYISKPSSVSDVSSKSDKNWFDDDESDVSKREESEIPSIPVDDESSTDESEDEPDEETEIEINEITIGVFLKDAKSQRIAITKSSALAATQCVTNPDSGMTAIFDGTITRFFSAVKIEFDKAVYGKYLLPNGESFELGEIGLGYCENAYYSTADNAAFYFDGTLTSFSSESLVVCRKLEADYSLAENWLNNEPIEIDKSSLSKYGVVKNGKTIIPFEYDSISTYATDEEVGVYRCVKDGRTYYISSSGYNLTPDGFTCGSEPYKNRAWVYEGSQGYILEFK